MQTGGGRCRFIKSKQKQKQKQEKTTGESRFSNVLMSNISVVLWRGNAHSTKRSGAISSSCNGWVLRTTTTVRTDIAMATTSTQIYKSPCARRSTHCQSMLFTTSPPIGNEALATIKYTGFPSTRTA